APHNTQRNEGTQRRTEGGYRQNSPSGRNEGGPRPQGGGTRGPSPYPQRNGGAQHSAPQGYRPAGGERGSRPPGGGGTSHGGNQNRPPARHGGPPGGSNRPGQHGPANRNNGRPSTPQRNHERRTAAVAEKPTGPISIPPQIVVKDLAELLRATPNEIIRGLIKHSIFASINQVVDYEKAALVAQDLGFEPTQSELTVAPAVQRRREGLASEILLDAKYDANMIVIPPVVTIMGHVDHGKTTLLDTIRKTKVAAGEAGGITQHIGAYQVEINGQKITFLDTPGHEAFTAMRARGAQVADIAVIVVAADDGVMPQTREAIDHAQAAKMPIIIALNKMDKADANPDHVKQQLAEIGIVIEEYGGDVVCVPVSARRGTGIDDLLEMIVLVAEVQDIKANPNRPATGVIIEARLEKSSGATATVLVQQGTLKMGDNVVVGSMSGKIRAMTNDRSKRVMKAPPSTPVSILGLPEVPQAGDRLEVVADERTAKQIATRVSEQRKNESTPMGTVSLDTLYMQMQEGKVKELNIILKCDVQGSAEALKNALSKIGEENLKVRLIREGIGNISETDVHLAAASGAIIIGFNVNADGAAQRMAQKEGVDIRYYNIIYKLTDDIQAALAGMLEPTFQEVIEGHAEVQQTFKAGKNLVIAGCRVQDGKLTRASQARVLRNQNKVYEGKVGSLRRGKDDVREVAGGYECGIVLEDFSDFEVGDIIETFTQEKVKPGA
ncbi:MAG TPA: translation initiation factor IF-2, partial [Ktedonobacteraceae bacterium]|nr:translation initiation factor IF-2 [Ktedonobacteraceae bacterium]